MGGDPLILVDTHVLIWLDQDDPALGRSSRTLVDEALREGALAASAVSFWEIAMLVAKRRIIIDMPLAKWSYVQNLLQKGFDHVAECCRGHGWRVDIRYRSAGHAQPPSGGLLHQLAFVLRQ